MEKDLKQLLEDGIKAIDPDIFTPQLSLRLETYFDQIKLFNHALGLVNADDRSIVSRHILDSLAPLPFMHSLVQRYLPLRNIEVADLGSGNGMPGLVLACARNDWRFFLVERMGRRAGFLRHAVAMTGMASSVQVLENDIAQVRRTFDVLVMRAFRPLDAVQDKLLSICHEDSLVFVWTAGTEHGVSVLRKTCAGVFQRL